MNSISPRSHWPRWCGVCASIAILATVSLTSACGGPTRDWPSPASGSGSATPSPDPSPAQPATAPAPAPAPVSAPASGAGPAAAATPTGKPNPAEPKTLEDYLAAIPSFPPAPDAKPVIFPKGPAAEFIFSVKTKDKVAFITIDDGIVRHPWAEQMIRRAGVPLTLFLTTNYVKGHTDYFTRLAATGLVDIENHTVSHPDLATMGNRDQQYQLCTASDALQRWFGERPTLFRPPFGEIDHFRDPDNSSAMKAAWACGLRAGFYWWAETDQGKVVIDPPYQQVQPGMIVLMHFREDFPSDFLATLEAIKKGGLTPAFLSDYVAAPA